MGDQDFGSEDVYWASLPVHLRNFIRNSLPLTGNLPSSGHGSGILPGGVHAAGGQMAMYQMAQQIIGAANLGALPGGATLKSCRPVEASGYQGNGLGSLSPMHADVAEYAQSKAGRIVHDRGIASQVRVNHNVKLAPLETMPAVSDETQASLGVAPVESGEPEDMGRDLRGLSRRPEMVPEPKEPSAPPINTARTLTSQELEHKASLAKSPSIRAAGKQPMHSVQPGGQGVNTSTATPPVNRSARSAGKAPALNANPPTSSPGMSSTNPSSVQKVGANTATSKIKPSGPTTSVSRDWRITEPDERARMMDYWSDLDPNSRRKLVQTEKEGVLRRMRDYQRHTCTCSVCGRKRTAIEAELVSRYEIYRDELEAFASRDSRPELQGILTSDGASTRPFPGSVEVDHSGNIIQADYLAPPSHVQKLEHDDDSINSDEEYDDEEEEEDDYEEDDDDLGDEDEIAHSDGSRIGHDLHPSYESSSPTTKTQRSSHTARKDTTETKHDGAQPTDFLTFPGHLASLKGVLSVADDLVKGDGQSFLELMEQLAERRVKKEENLMRTSIANGVYADETAEWSDDEYNSDKDELESNVFQASKLDESMRLFQVFAARLFEQRVLQAYREQVAQQKQLQFLKELEDEENAAEAREARKAKDAQKKKDKRKQQKQAKEDERLRREAVAEAEAATLRIARRNLELEANKRRDEDRLRKEAERKAKLEDIAKKEQDRRRRQIEDREKEARRRERADTAFNVAQVRRQPVSQAAKSPDAASRIVSSLTAISSEEPIATSSEAQLLGPIPPRSESTKQPTAATQDHDSSQVRAGEDLQVHRPVLSAPTVPQHPAVTSIPADSEMVQASELRNGQPGVPTVPLDQNRLPASRVLHSPGRKQRVVAEDLENIGTSTLSKGSLASPSPQGFGHIGSLPVSPHPHFNGAVGSSPLVELHVPSVDAPSQSRIAASTSSYSGPIEMGAPSMGHPFRGNPLSLELSATRPGPIGPIQPPIGRPRGAGPSEHTSGVPTPAVMLEPSAQRVLGSAALSSGDDDEVVVAPPRRISQAHGSMRSTWSSNSPANSAAHWSIPYAVPPADIWSATPTPLLPWAPAGGHNTVGTGNPRYDTAAGYPAYRSHEKLSLSAQAGRNFGFDTK